jgi:hypothetical protein
VVKAHVAGLVWLTGSFLCGPLYAQKLPLKTGDVVRVSAPRCGLDGHTMVFQAQRNDSLVFEKAPCPLANITNLEVHRGKKRHWLLGAGVGLLAGAGVGVALFASSGGVESCTGACWGVVGAIYGAGPGVLLGAGIGALIRTDRWKEVPLPELSVGLSRLSAGRFGIGTALRF